MTLSDLAPNWDILKQPWNWVLVLISIILLCMVLHLFFRNYSSAEEIGGTGLGNS